MLEIPMRTSYDDETTVEMQREVPTQARPVMLRLEPWVRALLPRQRRLVPRGF